MKNTEHKISCRALRTLVAPSQRETTKQNDGRKVVFGKRKNPSYTRTVDWIRSNSYH